MQCKKSNRELKLKICKEKQYHRDLDPPSDNALQKRKNRLRKNLQTYGEDCLATTYTRRASFASCWCPSSLIIEHFYDVLWQIYSYLRRQSSKSYNPSRITGQSRHARHYLCMAISRMLLTKRLSTSYRRPTTIPASSFSL